MFQFTKQLDYGLQLTLALLRLKKGELLSLRHFSEDSKISFLFLQRIARSLKQAGIIEANKGAHGGYYLKADPKKLKLKDIVEAVEGEYAVCDCLKNGCHCDKEKNCETRKIFCGFNKEIVNYLSKYSILELTKYAE